MRHLRSLGATCPDTIPSRCARRGSRRGIAALAGCVIALAAAVPVAAGQFEKGHFHDVGEEVQEDFCDVEDFDVIHSWDISGSFNGVTHQGLVRFRESGRGTNVFTNPETGRSYTQVFNVATRDKAVTDNADGTLTILVQGSGSEKWYDGDGQMVLMNPGMSRWEILVDNAGTPSDPTDDEFIEFVQDIKPSTGRNDSEGRVFCEDFFLFTS